MRVREHTKVCDRALIPQATKQFARYDTPSYAFTLKYMAVYLVIINIIPNLEHYPFM